MCTVIEITTTFMRNKNISSSQIFSSRECGDCGVMEHDTGPESSWHHLLFQQSELSSNSWNSLFSISKLTGEFHDTFIHRPHKHDSLTGFMKQYWTMTSKLLLLPLKVLFICRSVVTIKASINLHQKRLVANKIICFPSPSTLESCKASKFISNNI